MNERLRRQTVVPGEHNLNAQLGDPAARGQADRLHEAPPQPLDILPEDVRSEQDELVRRQPGDEVSPAELLLEPLGRKRERAWNIYRDQRDPGETAPPLPRDRLEPGTSAERSGRLAVGANRPGSAA